MNRETLKTFKDLEEEYDNECELNGKIQPHLLGTDTCMDCGSHRISTEFKGDDDIEWMFKAIKQEAIKWIKFLKNHENKNEFDVAFYDNQLDDMMDEDGNFHGAIQWIAWFFQIKNKKGERWCNCCEGVEEIE